jgi:hypothetical protein
MKVSQLMLFGIFFIGISAEKTSLTLDEAIFGLGQKQRSFFANTKVDTKIRIAVCKEQQISWFKSCRSVPAVNKRIDWFKINKNNTATAEPVPIVNQLMLGE